MAHVPPIAVEFQAELSGVVFAAVEKFGSGAFFFKLLYTPPVYPRRAVYTIPRVTDRAWVCGGGGPGFITGITGVNAGPGVTPGS